MVGAAVVCVAGVSSASIDPRSKPVTIRGLGLWTLHRLGYPRPWYSVPLRHTDVFDRQKSGLSFFYRLPRGAHQGPRKWYVARLHYRLQLTAKGVGEGHEAFIDTAGRRSGGCGGVVFRAKVVGESQVINWTNGGSYQDGNANVVTRVAGPGGAPTIGGVYRNYCIKSSITPGVHLFRIRGLTLHDVRVDRLLVANDSGMQVTRTPYLKALSPMRGTPVGLIAEPPSESINAGDSFKIALRVVRIFRSRAPTATFTTVRAGPVEVTGLDRRSVPLGPLGSESDSSFSFRAIAPGTAWIFVRATVPSYVYLIRLMVRPS